MNTLKRQSSAILWVIRKSPLASSFYILLQIAAGLVPAVRILALARIVDSLSRKAELRAAALPLGVLMLTLAWDVVVPSFASFLEQRIQAVSAAELQKGVLRKQARLKAEVLENKTMRERMERLQKQADDSIGLIFYRIINLLQSLVALVSQLTIFCGVRLWLGPAFLLAGVPALWIASKAGRVEYEENRRSRSIGARIGCCTTCWSAAKPRWSAAFSAIRRSWTSSIRTSLKRRGGFSTACARGCSFG